MPSTIHWPTGLPKALAEDHGYSPRSAALAKSFGITSRSRRIYSDAPADLRISLLLRPEQWAYFEGFYAYALDMGTLWFWMPVTVAGVTEEREVSFNGQPFSAVRTGFQNGRLSASVVTRKGTQMDPDIWAGIAEYGDLEEYLELITAFNQFAEVDMPAPTFKES